MSNNFHLTIRTPDAEVLDSKDIHELRVNTEEGPITVYAKHASLTGSILFSTLVVKTKDGEERFMARRGTIFVDMEKNHASLLLLSCEEMEKITFEKAEEYLAYVENLIESGEDLSSIKLAYLEKEKLAISEQVSHLKKVK